MTLEETMLVVAEWIVRIVLAWFAVGLLFAVPFVVLGVGRIDAAAREGSWGFRALIVPGVALFWPWLAWRWYRGSPPPEECTAHRSAVREPGP